MKRFLIILFLSIFLSFSIALAATTIHVPTDQPTIQEGIDAAVNGDTVLVADDTYTGVGNKNLDFGGRAITLQSENGPENCIIDCEGAGRGFYFHNGEGLDSVVSGFTVTNGTVTTGQIQYGSGIFCWHSSPTIRHCIITHNIASLDGTGSGGGIACDSSTSTIEDCIITYNIGSINYYGHGAGIHCFASSPTITNCTISHNKGSVNGRGGGAGIYCGTDSSPIITNCVISENTGSDFYIGQGGGIYAWNTVPPVITNCTIVGNNGTVGGGVYCRSPMTFTSCILWGNSPEQIFVDVNHPYVPTVTYSDIQGGFTGGGNIDSDPLFADPGNDDYHLTGLSLCINTGNNDAPDLPATDKDGNPRIIDGTVDMGAYEFIAPGSLIVTATASPHGTISPSGAVSVPYGGNQTFTVTPDTGYHVDEILVEPELADTEAGNQTEDLREGYEIKINIANVTSNITIHVTFEKDPITLRVPSEYQTIQAAIDAALNGGTVLVADGIYTGLGNKNLDLKGKAITVKSENGPENCIIDCENVGQGFYFHSGESFNSVVWGFTLTNGNVTYGGGIHLVNSSSPCIKACIIKQNIAQNSGGGITCDYLSSPSIMGCEIAGNIAGSWGGGIWCIASSSPAITNCVIFGNEVLGIGNGGGGIGCYPSCSPLIMNCTITGNIVSDKGGGVFSHELGSPTVVNSIIWGNTPNEVYGATVGITYSDVQGGHTGEGNINSDPMFRNMTLADYNLRAGSPCIDLGTSAGAPSEDIDGTPRPQSKGFDMGAYEFVLKAMPWLLLLLLGG